MIIKFKQVPSKQQNRYYYTPTKMPLHQNKFAYMKVEGKKEKHSSVQNRSNFSYQSDLKILSC